jgi:hypothetical protein
MSGAKRASQSRTGASREHKTALQEHLRQITEAQFIAKPPEHDEQDDIGGVFQIVERGPGAFVEDASAGRTAERSIAQRCGLALLRGYG